MQIPINEKTSLNLMHGFITFQIYLNTTKSFTIEIAISDTNNGKKRILLSACSKEFIINQLHCRIPIISIPTNIDDLNKEILQIAIDSIILSADCKIRRICGMRQLYTLSEEEFLQGDDSILPKGFILPNEIKHININFDMNYIKQTVDIKNIKNNNYLAKDKRSYPKTSQSKREGKLSNTVGLNQNQVNENQKVNLGNKIIRKDQKSKSINKQKLKNHLDNELYKNNNKFKKELEENNKNSTRNLKNINGVNKLGNFKNDKKNERKNNFLLKNKSKEKINSKSMGKVYIKNKANTFINGKNIINNANNANFRNDKNIKKTTVAKTDKKNSIINNEKNPIKDNKSNNINYNNMNQSPKILESQIINNKINSIPKEELNLFNTFNYKEIESKENTLLINQSNFNNASIPEIVDLDTNNTYLKNFENDINSNINGIIMIDKKGKDYEPSFNNYEQMDSLISEKILCDLNGNKNERPYTPPLQKIIPVNNENDTTLNNVNITKINESIIQNHYNDLVYDKETGRFFDKKTKIFYDFK